jgi:hypothetical protein
MLVSAKFARECQLSFFRLLLHALPTCAAASPALLTTFSCIETDIYKDDLEDQEAPMRLAEVPTRNGVATPLLFRPDPRPHTIVKYSKANGLESMHGGAK